MDNIINKNEIYVTYVEGYTSEALGVCHVNGRTVFVPGALMGEKLKVRITKVNSSVAYGRIEELLIESNNRRIPLCANYKLCGGCNTRHMSYEEELRFKLDKVNSCLERIGHQSIKAETIIPSEDIYEYRNKVTFSVAWNGESNYYGFYSPRSHKVVMITDCGLQNAKFCKVADAVISFANNNDFIAYDENTNKGYLRHIFVRGNADNSSFAVCITTAKGFGDKTSLLTQTIIDSCPFITGIVLNINKEPGNELLKGDFYTLYGSPDVSSTLCGFSFSISPKSFFQINTKQAEKLYDEALNMLSVRAGGTALDLYCGIGTISLCLSKIFEKVIGVEIVPPAVDNAISNAKANGVSNAEFICADAGQALKILKERNISPNAVVVDPPRKGMSEDAIDIVAEMKPEQIVYVSCNPATLARDILIFNERGYTLKRATAVDMFPGTYHVETCVLLVRE